jgi:hypothetical protein
MTTTTVRLTGQALIDFVNEKMPTIDQFYTRTDMVRDAGYINDNGSGAYVDFYTELLKAKEVLDPNYVSKRDAEDAEYEAMSGVEQELYDAITHLLGSKWAHEETIEFMDELDQIGINSARQFEDAYEYTHDSYSAYAEKEFAEYFCIEVMNVQIPDIVLSAVDWQDVWDHNLRYDYNCIETNNGTFFFRSY